MGALPEPSRNGKLETWVLVLVVSLIVAIPCFWLPLVSVADLQNHLYNAWLVKLIKHGEVSELWLASQNTNVLADWMLATALELFGPAAAERLFSLISVLCFFWGAFAYLSRVFRERADWVIPWLAVLTYGFVFQIGLLNFYLAAGICLWLLTLLQPGLTARRVLIAAPLAALTLTAHPIPVLWLVGVTVHRLIASRLPRHGQAPLMGAYVVGLVGLRLLVMKRFEALWSYRQLGMVGGADQALTFGRWYAPVALAIVALFVLLLVGQRDRWRVLTTVQAQSYFLTAGVIALLPTAIRLDPQKAWISLVAERLSLLAGVLLLAALGQAPARRWQVTAGAVVAIAFFGLLRHDLGQAAAVEAKVAELASTLPPGSRLVAQLPEPRWGDQPPVEPGGRKHLNLRRVPLALVARACIGRCWDYGNYEASSGQFRVRARPGSTIVMQRIDDVYAMGVGLYQVKASDPPLHHIYSCGPAITDLCMRVLQPGELNGKVASLR